MPKVVLMIDLSLSFPLSFPLSLYLSSLCLCHASLSWSSLDLGLGLIGLLVCVGLDFGLCVFVLDLCLSQVMEVAEKLARKDPFAISVSKKLMNSHVYKVMYLVLCCVVALCCLVMSCHVMSCHVVCFIWSCVVLCCLILCCVVLCCVVLSCFFLACLALSCLVMSYLGCLIRSYSCSCLVLCSIFLSTR